MSYPFLEIAEVVIGTAPQVIFNPAAGLGFVFYWAMAVFVFGQYRRTTRLQGQLYGRARFDALRMTMIAAAEGLVVGLMGSYLVSIVGLSLPADGGGLTWVLGAAVALMLVNARLMCFSYAGGLVSLFSLVFGFPEVSVPSLMGLVAILHLMESLLILTSGASGATPVYLEQGGRQVGGFHLQRAWPLPVALLVLVVLTPAEAGQGLGMPDWWPLLRTDPELLAHPFAAFVPFAIPAALGYTDLALTCPPKVKTRRTALNLSLYSLALLGLAIASTYYTPLVWVAAVFAPLAHEALVRLGNRREMSSQPFFVPPGRGVMILDAVPGSVAAKLGLGPGWVILEVNGASVAGREELGRRLDEAAQVGRLHLRARAPEASWARGRGWQAAPATRDFSISFAGVEALGVIPAPEAGDDMGLTITRSSPLLHALGRLSRLFRGRRLRRKSR